VVGRSGRIGSLCVVNNFGGGSGAMLVNGGQAFSSPLSRQTLLVFAASEVVISA